MSLTCARRADLLDDLDRLHRIPLPAALLDPTAPELPRWVRGRARSALAFAASTVATCACRPGVVHEVRISKTGAGSFDKLWMPLPLVPLVDLAPLALEAWHHGTPGDNAAWRAERHRFVRRDPLVSVAMKLVVEHEELIRRVAAALLLLGNDSGIVSVRTCAKLCRWVRARIPSGFVERTQGLPAAAIFHPDVVERMIERASCLWDFPDRRIPWRHAEPHPQATEHAEPHQGQRGGEGKTTEELLRELADLAQDDERIPAR